MSYITKNIDNRYTMYEFSRAIRLIVNWPELSITITKDSSTIDVFPIDKNDYTIQEHQRLLHHIDRISSRKRFPLTFSIKNQLKNIRTTFLNIVIP